MSIPSRKKVNPEGEKPIITPLTGEQQAGVRLAYILLGLIGALIIVFTTILFTKSFEVPPEAYEALRSPDVSDSSYVGRVQHLQIQTAEKKEYREFITKNIQYAIGILIPVLTSVLGYIFGTKARG